MQYHNETAEFDGIFFHDEFDNVTVPHDDKCNPERRSTDAETITQKPVFWQRKVFL